MWRIVLWGAALAAAAGSGAAAGSAGVARTPGTAGPPGVTAASPAGRDAAGGDVAASGQRPAGREAERSASRADSTCADLVEQALAEIAAGHWNPAVRAQARGAAGAAASACRDGGVPGAVRAALDRLDDPAIRLLRRAQFDRMVAEWNGEALDGVGLTEVLSIDTDEATRRLTVIAPVPGSPAAAAGLGARDVIVRIDGASTDSLGLTASAERLRVDAGERVALQVLRNDETRQVTLAAEALPPLDALRVERRAAAGFEALVVALRQFTPGVAVELRAAVAEAGAIDGIVLDLRGNPGGLVDELIATAGVFLDAGSEIGRLQGPEPARLRTGEPGPATALPLAVAVDAGTASAAEALAATLRAHGRGRLYGERTFGKGLAHAARPLGEGEWVLMLPIGQLETPDGRRVLGRGVDPDVRTANPVTEALRDFGRAEG